MKFHEKLSFLMNLTQTSNKTLSSKLNVDPSLISMLKTGKRKLPKNTDYIHTLAEFFGKNCTSEYQRYSLSDIMHNENIRLISSPTQLADIIFNWLNDSSIDSLPKKPSEAFLKISTDQGIPPPEASVDIFYTVDGRRGALNALHEIIRQTPVPKHPFNTLFMSIDEDIEWIYEDLEFFTSLQRKLFRLISDGMRLCHVIHSNTDPKQLVEYLKLWLPLYATGEVDAHWCYHPKPQIYRRSIILAPLSGAIFYNTANTKRDDPATLITTDRQLMHSLTYEFQSHFPFYKPLLNKFTGSESFLECMETSRTVPCDRIQQTPSLPAWSTPVIIVDHCIESAQTESHKRFLKNHKELSASFEKELTENKYSFTDIGYLASASAVKNGEIRVILSNSESAEPLIYTPEMYVLHLQNILYFLDKYPNYNFIPSSHRLYYDFILMVHKEHQATLIRTAPPFNSYSITQPDMVNACFTLLSNERDFFMMDQTRESIKQRIRDLIAELS